MTDTPKRPPGRPRKRPRREPDFTRPYAVDGRKDIKLTLDPPSITKLDDLASESGMSRSAVVRRLIDEA